MKTIRDPLWNTIRLDDVALRIIDAPEFQRLRHIRQLGLAYLVYPGATHSRFDHALGVYHLASRALRALDERGERHDVDPDERRLIPYAALLHDIGHYPFSHALEELEEEIPLHHEALTGRFLQAPAIRGAVQELASDAPERIEELVRGRSASPLQGLVAGSLDLDKIEYLRRDAFFCGVPYGEVDVDRLIDALTVVSDPATGAPEVGIREKGLSAVESLLFAKYQMFRNVYWHHAVRAATVLYKRLVQEALAGEVLSAEELVGQADERLLAMLELRGRERPGPLAARVVERRLPALRERRLPKRALELPGETLRGRPGEAWLADAALRSAVERQLQGELELPEGGVYLDYPEKPRMMGLDLLLLHSGGSTHRIGGSGSAGLIGLPRIADDLYRSARVLRVFTEGRRRIPRDGFEGLLELAPDRLRARLDDPAPLL
ncbi:hypothetical protein BH20GEM2_BH20GEM2_12810 [soil metagenome]